MAVPLRVSVPSRSTTASAGVKEVYIRPHWRGRFLTYSQDGESAAGGRRKHLLEKPVPMTNVLHASAKPKRPSRSYERPQKDKNNGTQGSTTWVAHRVLTLVGSAGGCASKQLVEALLKSPSYLLIQYGSVSMPARATVV